jgi:prevent-host-death family protein
MWSQEDDVRTVQLREAKARFSALVAAAERGEATVVTKHGRPAAMVVPVDGARPDTAEKKPNFAEWLMSMPHDIPIRRNRSRARSVKF